MKESKEEKNDEMEQGPTCKEEMPRGEFEFGALEHSLCLQLSKKVIPAIVAGNLLLNSARWLRYRP